MPEDLVDLDPATQQYHVQIRAAWLMFVGTALVLIFSGELPCKSKNSFDLVSTVACRGPEKLLTKDSPYLRTF